MLALKGVRAGYGGFQALFDVSLEVRRGEAVGVIGPNGAGKTTLMRVISGLIRPTAGSIVLDGIDLVATPAHRIVERGIAHVPENRRLFPRMSVEDNLKMGGFAPAARGKFAERLQVVYALFPRLRERRRQLAGTMSGGEQQMCAIGRALMSDPQLLLLDEPSAGLAPVIVQHLFELVKQIGIVVRRLLDRPLHAVSHRPKLALGDDVRRLHYRGRLEQPPDLEELAEPLPGQRSGVPPRIRLASNDADALQARHHLVGNGSADSIMFGQGLGTDLKPSKHEATRYLAFDLAVDAVAPYPLADRAAIFR